MAIVPLEGKECMCKNAVRHVGVLPQTTKLRHAGGLWDAPHLYYINCIQEVAQ